MPRPKITFDSNAVTIYGEGARRGPMIVTCEHASARVPHPLRTNAHDRPWLKTHWGYDIGAATVAREIIRQSGSAGVFARFSRLVCDPNRSTDHPDWIRRSVEGHPLTFNRRLDANECKRRRSSYYEPYHDAVDRILDERLKCGGDVLLLSVHSFTPVLGNERRDMEIGVLFDRYAAVATRLAELLRDEDFKTELNQPYSGMAGMMFAANRHGSAHNVVYLETEVRQDLTDTAPKARAVGKRFASALERLTVRLRSR